MLVGSALVAGLGGCEKPAWTSAPQAADTVGGDLLISYTPPTESELDPFYRYMQGANVQATMLPVMRLVSWPKDLHLETRQCGSPNAYYYPGDARIVTCYELAQDFHRRAELLMKRRSPEYRKQVVIGGMKFVFLHEMGHAVYDAFDIPVLGNPEDAADAFAIYVLLHCKDPASDWILKGAKFFFMKNYSDFGSTDELKFGAFSDAHPLHQQRYFNMLCYAYGSNPQRYAALVENGFLPKGRAASCGQDWERLDQSMRKVLAGHFNLAALDDAEEQAKHPMYAPGTKPPTVDELPFGLGPLPGED
ncbi:DUF4344 domain-containing metallopeptidase [Chitinibacteraceae bacterium HSL-7]